MHAGSLMHFQQPEKSAFCAKAHFHLCVEHSMAAGGPDLVIGVCSQSRLQLCSPRKPPVVPVPVVPPWHPRAVLPSRVTAPIQGHCLRCRSPCHCQRNSFAQTGSGLFKREQREQFRSGSVGSHHFTSFLPVETSELLC